MVFGFLAQVLGILSLKVEEAHVVSLVDNAVNIIISFAFQALFFLQPAGTMKVVGPKAPGLTKPGKSPIGRTRVA